MAKTGVPGGPKIALFGALAGPLYLGYFKGLNGDSRVFAKYRAPRRAQNRVKIGLFRPLS